MVDFYTFYTNGNRNKYSITFYLMAWWHVERHKSFLHRVKHEHWTTSLCNSGKTLTFVSIITLMFLSQFLYFLYQWKQEWILYREVNKIYNITLTVSPHYLTQKQHILRRLWPTASCIEFDRISCSQLSEKVVYLMFIFLFIC